MIRREVYRMGADGYFKIRYSNVAPVWAERTRPA